MKRVLEVVSIVGLIAVCIGLLSGCAPKRNFAGTWTGTITISMPQMKQPMTVPLTIHVSKKDDGTYTAAVDGPMNNSASIPLKIDGDKVTFGTDKQGSGFTGTSNADGTEISGNLAAAGQSLPLVLKKQPDAK